MIDHGSQRQQDAAAVSGGPAPNVTNVPGVLKAFVITSGIMLLIGGILLTVMIMLKAGSGDEGDEVSSPSAPVDLALPAGAKVNEVIADGKRLVLLAEDQDGQQYLAVVDALSGERLSLIRVNPSP